MGLGFWEWAACTAAVTSRLRFLSVRMRSLWEQEQGIGTTRAGQSSASGLWEVISSDLPSHQRCADPLISPGCQHRTTMGFGFWVLGSGFWVLGSAPADVAQKLAQVVARLTVVKQTSALAVFRHQQRRRSVGQQEQLQLERLASGCGADRARGELLCPMRPGAHATKLLFQRGEAMAAWVYEVQCCCSAARLLLSCSRVGAARLLLQRRPRVHLLCEYDSL